MEEVKEIKNSNEETYEDCKLTEKAKLEKLKKELELNNFEDCKKEEDKKEEVEDYEDCRKGVYHG